MREERRQLDEAQRREAAARRRRVAGQLAASALGWGLGAWIEGSMWVCLGAGLAVNYVGSYADLASTFGAFGYDGWVRWIMPLGIDLPVTASVLGQLLAGRWKCRWWSRRPIRRRLASRASSLPASPGSNTPSCPIWQRRRSSGAAMQPMR